MRSSIVATATRAAKTSLCAPSPLRYREPRGFDLQRGLVALGRQYLRIRSR